MRDRLVEVPLVRVGEGMMRLAASKLPLLSPDTRHKQLALAARRLAGSSLTPAIGAALRSAVGGSDNPYRTHEIGWARYAADLEKFREHPALTTSLIVKAPGPGGEPGVLYVSFEYNWLRILKQARWKELLKDYVLVGASSWSPTDFAVLASLVGASPHPVFIGVSNMADMGPYRMFGDAIVPLPIMACDWIDPSLYAPLPKADRDIDILMVAHWGRFKRHHLLFEALTRMSPSLRVVLVGRDTEGRTASDMVAEARRVGCRQEIETFTRIPNAEVSKLQARAKVAIVLSAREGSCVAVTESMCADTPVALMRGAVVGAAAHINDETGAFLDRPDMARQLSALIERHASMRPRRWIEANVNAQMSSERMNATLAAHAALRGRWSTDIAPMRWVYVPTYLRDSDHEIFAPLVAEFEGRYGMKLVEYPRTPGMVG